MRLGELRRRLGGPAQTTLRGHLTTEKPSIGGDKRLVCSVVYGLHELLHDPENEGSPFSGTAAS